jgi:DtxR family transcriptional regulator, Mn-dependent transcriptional regulator
MEHIQKIEEALSVVWEEREKGVSGAGALKTSIIDKVKEDMLDCLAREGYVAADKDTVIFTEIGETKAKDITRRQRLAERLLMDVLELSRKETDSSACEFEHILSKEVEEGICTLLGHPKECPHGLPIPPGECCAKANGYLESIVVPVSKLVPGEAGRIVYVLTRAHPQLHKLMSLGVIPGTRIALHQVSPSFVIQVEETQLALEKELADEIYVKRLIA